MKNHETEITELFPKLGMKELLEMSADIEGIENALQAAVEEDSELAQHIAYLQEIAAVLKEEIENAKKLKQIDLRTEIRIFAHLNLLEELLIDVMGPALDESFDDEENEEDDEGCCELDHCHTHDRIVSLDPFERK